MAGAINFGLGGTLHRVDDAHPTTTLLDYIRDRARLQGTKEGCNEGDCGACTVVLAEKSDAGIRLTSANACILLLGMVHGKVVLTVEDLSDGDSLHPIQARMVETHGSQCGFCTPGIVMSLYAHRESGDAADTATLNDWLAGNLCRCTGYRPILDAARLAKDDTVPTAVSRKLGDRLALLDDLAHDGTLVTGDETCFFAAPTTLDAAIDLMRAHPDATLLAGATDVGLWITKEMRHIEKIVSLNRIKALHTIDETPDRLNVGAMASYADVADCIQRLCPDYGTLWRRIGSRQIRASGTVGGNIANGSPIGDTPPMLITLGATIDLVGPEGSRQVLLEDFFLAYGKQDRAPGEILTRITIPKPGPDTHLSCFKVSKRLDEDITAVLGAFAIQVAPDGTTAAVRAAYGGMAGTPQRASHLEDWMTGKTPRAALHGDGIETAIAADFTPLSDARASASYRSIVAANLARKALMALADHSVPRIDQPEPMATHA